MKQLYTIIGCVVICHLFVPMMLAQSFTDIAAIRQEYHFPTQFKEDISVANKKSFSNISAELTFPLQLGDKSKKNYLLIGGQYSKQDVRFHQNEELLFNDSYFILEGRLGTSRQWKNKKDKSLILLLPKWSGSSPFLRKEAFQFGFLLLQSRRMSERVGLKYGLYYNYEFFGHFFVPLLGLDWKINDKVSLYGILPRNLQLQKNLSPHFAVSVSYASQSGSWLRNSEDGTYVRVGKKFPPYSFLSADLQYTVFRHVVFKASVGHTLFRDLSLYDSDDNRLSAVDYSPYRNGAFIKLALLARVYDDDDDD